MPITRCPKCGARQLVEKQVIGLQVACIRCGSPFLAAVQTGFGHTVELLLAGAAVLVGVVVSWLIVRGH